MEGDMLENSDKGLFGRTADHFPSLFRAADRRVNMNKARDRWKKRSALHLALEEERQHKYARSAVGGRHQLVIKALGGRGRKLDPHWEWLYPQLLHEFKRLRRAGLKLTSRLLMDMASTMVEDSPHPIFNRAYRFGGKTFSSLVTPRRIQDFTERHNIVYRKLKGKKQVSEEKMAQIEQSVARHLGTVKRLFEDGVLDPDQQFNMGESHFVIDLDDGKTLDFRGAEKVKYRIIVSGREGITMCVLLRGGSDAKILCPMLIIKNKKSSYPINGLGDRVDGVAYRSSPSAFINNTLMLEWLQEVRCWGPAGPFAKERHLWMDNASGHSGEEVQLLGKELRTRVRFFPPNATDFVQPADRFPIQRINVHWRNLCEKRNMPVLDTFLPTVDHRMG